MTAAVVTTRDGSSLRTRPIEPGDKRALADGFARLSEESRYRRFFAPLSSLKATDLHYLTEVDHRDHEAIIGFDADSGDAVGVARFVRSEDPRVAEVAVTVIDDWHGRGVATALLEQLVVRAREEGIEQFLALVLEENEAAIELFRALSSDDPEPRRSASGNLELLIELPEDDAISGTMLARALRTAAHGSVVMNPWRVLKRRLRETGERPPGGRGSPE